jgi:A/G-specific adenine glycosylase
MYTNKAQQQYFTTQLMAWHETDNTRTLPWKQEKDPYKIWLSEIILQQTRALQGLPYYLAFTQAYPTVEALAKADEEAAFRLWQGLGYYNRCRNMLATAKYITGELQGKFPNTYDTLLALKGIGPYTAAAIASFTYGLPHAVVDGNVYRVLARYFGIETATDTTEGKKLFYSLAQQLLDTGDSSGYNQAIMDLGATVCTPANPKCTDCPLQKKCVAYKQELTDVLPVKSKKIAVTKRYFHYIILKYKDSIWIEKRTGKDIWQNLYQPFLIEHTSPLDINALLNDERIKTLPMASEPVYEGVFTQKLTHRIIEARFYTILLSAPAMMQSDTGIWVKIPLLKNYAFPKTAISFLEKKLYF